MVVCVPTTVAHNPPEQKSLARPPPTGFLRAVLLAKDVTLKMHAACVGDLSIEAAALRNATIPTYPCTYYFSYVTQHCRRSLLNAQYYWPHPDMHWMIMVFSAVTGRWQPVSPPYPSFRAQDWFANDGPVSVISQRYPFVVTREGFRVPAHLREDRFRGRYPEQVWEGVQAHPHAPLLSAMGQVGQWSVAEELLLHCCCCLNGLDGLGSSGCGGGSVVVGLDGVVGPGVAIACRQAGAPARLRKRGQLLSHSRAATYRKYNDNPNYNSPFTHSPTHTRPHTRTHADSPAQGRVVLLRARLHGPHDGRHGAAKSRAPPPGPVRHHPPQRPRHEQLSSQRPLLLRLGL